MSYRDKKYVVFVVKVLTSGHVKYSYSHYGYNTYQGASRCLSKMLARRDVFLAKICSGDNFNEKKKKN